MRYQQKCFEGQLYPSSSLNKAVIVVTGSDGGIEWSKQIASAFSVHGISALAFAYWNTPDTSKSLSLIAIESIQPAVRWLRESGYSEIGVYGFSKGAELALLAGSLIPQLQFVVAVSPACCVFEGIAKPSYSGASSWTWKGCPVPYVSFDGASTHTVKNLLKNREFGFREQYLDVLSRNKKEENTIKVENINGSILLLSAKEDAQWPSAEMGEMICERLKEKRFEYPYHHEVYHPASHFLCPVRTPARLVYRQERLFPKECERARQDALRLSVEWIKRV